MKIDDDGTTVTITAPPSGLANGCALLFVGLSVIYVLIFVIACVLPHRSATIDADRGRGTCDFKWVAHAWTIPIADVGSARLVHDRGSRNRSPSDFVQILRRSDKPFDLGDRAYSSDVKKSMGAAVESFNRFLADPAQKTFATSFIAEDTDWFSLVCFGVLMPVMAWIFLTLGTGHRIELDRSKQSARITAKPRLGKGTVTDVAFSEIATITATTGQWVYVYLVTKKPERLLLFITPRFKSSLATARKAIDLVAQVTNARLDAGAAKLG